MNKKLLLLTTALMFPLIVFAQGTGQPGTAGAPIPTGQSSAIQLGGQNTQTPGTLLASQLSTGSSSASSYLGEVATHAGISTSIQSPGSNNTANSRSHHVATDTITSLQLVLPGWYVTSGSEIPIGSNTTYTAAIEYPVGVYTQVTFGGATSGSATSGANLVSDAVSISIPKFAQFYVRIFQSNSANGVLYATLAGPTSFGLLSDSYQSGLNLADHTMGGSIGQPASRSYFIPLAIIANTTQATACVIGDSRALGSYDSSSGIINDLGELAKGIGRYRGYINTGVSGEIAGLTTNYALRAALCNYTSTIVSEFGVNNIFISNQSLSQLEAALAITFAYFPNKPIYQTTLPPSTTTTDSCYTVTNQTVKSQESVRTSFNTVLRSTGLPGVQGGIDLAYLVETGTGFTTQPVINGGFWMADGTANGRYSGDCTHETNVGADLEARAIPWQSIINR